MDLRSRVSSSESDGEAVDSSVKILINDVTPCDSREFLHLAGLRSQLASQNDISGIAQKQTAKDHQNRRASWAHTKRSDIPLRLHRSWSLGNLASHLGQMCYGPSIGLSFHNRFSTTKEGSSDSIPEGMREKQRSFSAGSREDVFMFCNQLQDSAQSMSDIITNDVSQTLSANISEPKSVKKHSLISFGNKNSRKEEWLIAPRSTLQKSISTPSIVAAQEIQEIAHRRDGRDSSYGRNRYLAQNIRNSCIEIMHEEDEPEEMNIKRLSNFSLANLLRENLLKTGAQDGEDDKSFSKRKKRGSLFFRKKKNKDKDKDNKKSSHQFVSICFSTAATCSVCSRALANKSALKCENCCIAVHDSSCKDHVPPCVPQKVNTNPSAEKDVNASLLTSTGSIRYPSRYRQLLGAPTLTHSQSSINLGKHSQLSKEKRSSLTDINRVIVSSNPDPVKSSPTSSAPRKNYTPSGYSQWRRVATKLGVNKVICEEKEIVAVDENSTNMVETNSASIESLDETSQGTSDVEDDAMLQLLDEEPESWNGTVDKKVLKKLKEKDVKRQEAIYELILTEKHHCLTLKIMQRVFAKGMIQELNVSKDMVQRIFPCLDELLRIHLNFLQRLRERQKTEAVVSHIGDIIAQQFEGQNAEELVSCYSQFCSQHTDALSLYKDILKSDRKFQSFVKKCGSKAFCKARGIPECILLVTQRVTKYPLLLDALIKTTKDNKHETEKLNKALSNVKNIIAQVNSAVAEKEREIRLLEIYNRIDAKSTAFYKKEKFKKSDLLSDNRKLRFEGTLEWKSARGKVIDVHVIILSDVVVLLQENNQKYTFASLDNKAAVISLQKLLVREKAGQNSRGIYLISSNPTYPEMYEMLCSTPKDKKLWLQVIRDSVTMLLTEGKGLFKSESTQNAMQADDEKSQKLAELCATMQEKDMEIASLCEEKIKAMLESLTLLGFDKHKISNVDFQQLLQKDEEETEQALMSALSQACNLTSRVYYFDTNPYINPDDVSSSVNMSPVLPKRAETFAGFDNSGKDATDKVNVLKKKLMQLKELDGDCHNERELSSSDPSLHVKNKGETASNVKFISRLGSPERVRNSHSTKCSSQGGFNRIEEVAELNQLLATVMSLLQHQITLYRKEFGKKKYRPDNQLEELRNIQEKLSQERLQWENEKAKKEKELENKKAELILMEKRIQEQTKLTLHTDRQNSCCHENQDMSQNCSSLSLCKHRRSASFDFRTLGTLTQEIGGRQSWSGPVEDTSFICHSRCYSSQSSSNIGHDAGDSSVTNSQNDSEHSEHFDFGSPEAKDPNSPGIFYESSKSMSSSLTANMNCPGREIPTNPVVVQNKCLCPVSLVSSSHRYKGCTLNGGESIQNNYCGCRDSL